MSLIIFSHANSFPAGTYTLLFRSLRARGFTVKAIDKFGHDPRYPVTSNWPNLVRQLADFAGPLMARHAGPSYLVGHSLGGLLSLMCAARHPELGGVGVAGVLLLDSPLLGGWRAATLEVLKRSLMVGAFSPGRVSRRRREHWPDEPAALAHFSTKRVFSSWDPRVLADYVRHGTTDAQNSLGACRRVLSFERDVETAIYDTLPHNLDRLLNRHRLRCPVAFIGGRQSSEMQTVGMSMTWNVVGRDHPERIAMLDGSHLFPMERPLETAAAIEQMLQLLGRG